MVLFLLLSLAAPPVIAHCDDAVTDALHAQLDAEPIDHISVTCAERVVLLTRDDQHRLVARARLNDAELATRIVETLRQIQALPPELPLDAPRVDDHYKLELWVEPLGTLVFAMADAQSGNGANTLNAVYLKLGVTVPVSAQWELATAAGFFSANTGTGEEDPSPRWQAWISLAPVHFWHVQVGGPRSGFLLGPKLSAVFRHKDALHSSEPDLAYGSSDAFAVDVGFEAGFRYQAGRVDFTFLLPSVSLGVSTGSVDIMPQLGSGLFSYNFDFNLLRVGVSL